MHSDSSLTHAQPWLRSQERGRAQTGRPALTDALPRPPAHVPPSLPGSPQFPEQSLVDDALLQDDDEEDDDNEPRSWRR